MEVFKGLIMHRKENYLKKKSEWQQAQQWSGYYGSNKWC